MTQPSLGAFGKLPDAQDFVRIRAAQAPFGEFDAWLVESVEWAHARAGDGWREAFAGGALQAFVYRAPNARPGDAVLAGALAPSRDRASRQFPLSLGATLSLGPELLARPELVPIVLEGVWRDSSQLALERHQLGVLELEQRLTRLEPGLCPVADAAAAYGDWTRQLPVAELWAMLYPPTPDEQPERGLRLLLAAIEPYRGVERPRTPLSVRLPLGRVGGAAVCFWLDVVRRVAGWRETLPSFFWSHDGQGGSLLLHLGNPPPSTIAEIWLPSRTRDECFDVSSPLSEQQLVGVALLPAGLGSATRGGSISDLLEALLSFESERAR